MNYFAVASPSGGHEAPLGPRRSFARHFRCVIYPRPERASIGSVKIFTSETAKRVDRDVQISGGCANDVRPSANRCGGGSMPLRRLLASSAAA
jgi:hypothetical protein